MQQFPMLVQTLLLIASGLVNNREEISMKSAVLLFLGISFFGASASAEMRATTDSEKVFDELSIITSHIKDGSCTNATSFLETYALTGFHVNKIEYYKLTNTARVGIQIYVTSGGWSPINKDMAMECDSRDFFYKFQAEAR